MKKRLLWCLLSLSLSLTSQPVFAEETQRSPITGTRLYKNVYVQTPDLDSAIPETEERSLQPRFGYFWYCPTCDYKSCWHFLHSTAAAFAFTHTQKYDGHHPVIYEV
ncbi:MULTISPECIES: hypothetical protein [Enterococcus]|uniref:hypothetical protein n=1 Tax=Enterococcus TaxID=1350 RepID=UPI000280DCE0|nr:MULTISPECIES: hypothetical protein [Enterococcus]EKQ76818.1 hypothetical protein GMD5E_A04996 [Enterococcus sp. GMD5E]EGP4751348.1 hypothetical protein [Enterococcus faecium]EGP4837850.1 hypothetical protein [Enterococcus faecium]EGP5044246.1 hypothetical protein [Enterococcus faecium]EGP5129424.1 hypothetical protein [Enterococcus faecium]